MIAYVFKNKEKLAKLRLQDVKVVPFHDVRYLERDLVVSSAKALKRDVTNLEKAVVQRLPLGFVDRARVDVVVELVEVVNEALDGEPDVVGEELETFELDDDGEPAEGCADLGDEDRDESFVGFALEVDYGRGGGADCVGTCRNAFGEAGLLDAIGQREFAFGGDALTELA